MSITLYHGTTQTNALSILKNGFDFTKCGSNWGKTYGKGIYFTPNYDTAQFYAGDDGIVLSFNFSTQEPSQKIQEPKPHFYLIPHYLTRDISPYYRGKVRFPKDRNINCLVSPNNDEYMILYFNSY